MPQRETAWTTAMREFLRTTHASDPERWVTVDEVLAVGMAAVPDEVAAKEAGKKSGTLSEDRRLTVGRRAKAQQGLVGLRRFGKLRACVDEETGKKMVQFLGGYSADIGDIVPLRDRVAQLELVVEAQSAQIQFLTDKVTGQTDAVAAEFLASLQSYPDTSR